MEPGLTPASRVPGDDQERSAAESDTIERHLNVIKVPVNNPPVNNSDVPNFETIMDSLNSEDDTVSETKAGAELSKDTCDDVDDSDPDALKDSDIGDDDELLYLLSAAWDVDKKESDLPQPCECHQTPLGSCPANIAATVKLVQHVTKSGVPNRDYVQCPVGKLNIPIWKHRLQGYPDSEDVIAGNAFGWELGMVDGTVPVSSYRNHPSAMEYEESVDNYIKTELEHGTLCGPLPDDCGLDIIVSPIATVPKPPDKRRVIVDSSFPPGHGVNDAIPRNIYRGQYVKVSLPTVEDIVAGIRRVKHKYPGRSVVGFKCDKSRYYRNIPTCPRDWPKQCIQWKGKTYLDKAWSFGIRSAVQAAQRNSDAINWCYCNQEYSGHASLIREALAIPDEYSDEDIAVPV